MNIILLGAPGSGKGTEAKILSSELNLFHVSTGDIFRSEISNNTPLGIEASSYISKGHLVPDEITLNMVKNRLSSVDDGFLFDGFPRSLVQAEGLNEWFKNISRKIDAVVYLNVPENVIISRLTNRRTCSGCGKIYNLVTLPPKKQGICDHCGKDLLQRDDDKVEVISNRLKTFYKSTAPLMEFYKQAGVFYDVEASGSPIEVAKKISELLKK